METNNPKEHYEAPQTEVVVLMQEGIICASGPNRARRLDYEWEEW